MSNLSTSQLVYSLDGLPLGPMGLTPVSTEQLHRLGIHTLEQLACIALINLATERNAIIDLLEQDLRTRLWPAIVHCYTLLADQEGQQSQFVIESELFHFVASVVSPEEHKCTCTYKWLQTEFEEGIPFHKLKRTNASRQPKSSSENGSRYQVLQVAKQPPPSSTLPLETTIDLINAPKIERDHIESSAPTVDLSTLSVQQTLLPASEYVDFPPVVAALAVTHLNLSNRTNNMLGRWNIHTIGQLAAKSDEELLKLKNFGVKSLQEVRHALLNTSQETLSGIAALQERQRLITEFPALINHLDLIKNFPLRFLNLSIRTSNVLWQANIYTLGDLLQLYKPNLFEIRNLGVKAVEEIETVLQSIDIIEVQQIMRRLQEQGRTPANLPLTCLGLPNVASYRKLRACGIEHIEHLCSYTVVDLQERGFQSADIGSITAMLRVYGLALHGQIRLSEMFPEQSPDQMTADSYKAIIEQQEVPTTQNTIEQQPISVADAIRGMLSQVELRQAEVLRLRYGFENQPACTLEEIGQQIGVTRERVRQIEKKAINQLQRPHRRRLIEPLVLLLEQALRKANGVLSLQTVREVLSIQTAENSSNSESQIAFILLFAHQIQAIKDLPMIALNSEPYTACVPTAHSICAILRRIIANAFAPLSLAEVVAKFASDIDGKTIGLHIPEDFIIACLKAHPDIIVDEDGICGLKQWANKRLDDIIIVMRQHGKAMHYSEITERVNQRLPIEQQAKAHNVHAQIGRVPDIFVRVGHGIFGLAEWGLKQDRTLADAAYRVLCEANQALDIEQLTDRVLEIWHVKRSSVRAAVDLDHRFTTVGQSMYWLADTPLSGTEGKSTNDFDTLFGDVLLRRREELERDRANSNQHDALEDVRRLGTAIFG